MKNEGGKADGLRLRLCCGILYLDSSFSILHSSIKRGGGRHGKSKRAISGNVKQAW